ncbi:hypothetical protein FNU76_10870 [Chitinimonas arctica]|uniref:Leucine-rich repeat domain-containing protein n=1 Tax=Chitinimonas arctica TaxID=2594795 RepID=A0A516SF87_9NEIS|nr:hypothetical protein [Chitinimonas arctica]QDQ26827.1 hypothetical protein FNU76_10870 [Chitinimonas arctica]
MQPLPTRPPSVFSQPSGIVNHRPDWPDILRRLQANDATLTALSLSNMALDDGRIDELVRALETNSALCSLDLSHNRIGPEGARALSVMLTRNTGLVSLNLSHNPIGDTVIFVCLTEALKQNRQLLDIVVGDTPTHLSHPVVSLMLHNNRSLLRAPDGPAESTDGPTRITACVGSADGLRPITLPPAFQRDLNHLSASLSEQCRQLVGQGIFPASFTHGSDSPLPQPFLLFLPNSSAPQRIQARSSMASTPTTLVPALSDFLASVPDQAARRAQTPSPVQATAASSPPANKAGPNKEEAGHDPSEKTT